MALPLTDTFDGVEIVRFPLSLPADLTYGRVAQSQVSLLGRITRMFVMAHYLEAQYRATVRAARQHRRRRRARALGDSNRSCRGSGCPTIAGAKRHHDARW